MGTGIGALGPIPSSPSPKNGIMTIAESAHCNLLFSAKICVEHKMEKMTPISKTVKYLIIKSLLSANI